MKKHIKNIGIGLGLMAALALPVALPAGAAVEPGTGGSSSDPADFDLGRQNQEQGPILSKLFDCNNRSSNIEKQCIYVFSVTIVNILAAGVGIAVVAGIIYGSIVYATSGGAPQRSQQGITIITNALIALLVFFLMWALVNWLVPGGLFR